MSKGWKYQDTQAEIEAQRYENPIPSRAYIMEVLKNIGIPTTHEKLCKKLALKNENQQVALKYRLKAMLRDGQLMINRKQAYNLVDKLHLLKGQVQSSKEGHGFFIPENTTKQFYMSPKSMRKLFDGDIILANTVNQSYRRNEAIPIEIITRNTKKIIGRYEVNKYGISYLIPTNKRITHYIQIKVEKLIPVKGQYVVAEIIEYPDDTAETVAIVTEIIGYRDKPGIELEVILKSENIPHTWSQEVLAETNIIPLQLTNLDTQHRIDLRHLPFVTIDGDDSKDFDDAVYCCKKKSGGWRLYVAIADASYYVKPNTCIDNEAKLRGNSVYFPNYVVPMLPERLSNGICSLNPLEDRLVIACEITISEKGRISGYKFYEAVIFSNARLTYNQVYNFLTIKNKNNADYKKHSCLIPHLKEFYSFYKARIAARNKKGTINFDTTETKVIFNEEQKISNIVPIERNFSHKMIEEAMLCANIATARLFEKNNFLSLYRSHQGITAEKQFSLAEFLAGLGIAISKTKNLTTKDISILLEKTKKRSDYKIIQTVILRSMSPAIYSENNSGHFGLGCDAYTHFTSPIRRYPDLLVHRAIRQLIRSKKDATNVIKIAGAKRLIKKDNYNYKKADLHELGIHCSSTERRADIATRNTMDWLKCQYIKQHTGSTFNGTITTVTSFGLFVELDNIFVDGLLHISNLPEDYYKYDKIHHKLIASSNKNSYKLGSKLRVLVSKVDIENKMIDLILKPSKITDNKKKKTKNKKISDKKVKASSQQDTKTNKKLNSTTASKKKPQKKRTKK